jgi:hypothetical protein
MSPRIEKLRDAVQVMHHHQAAHAASVPVIELSRGEVAWDGVVEVFAITGHPKAKRFYAWSCFEKGEDQFYDCLGDSTSDFTASGC